MTGRRSRIVVVGSADFATDLMGMTSSNFNAAFVADAAEWLASGDELVAMKSRGVRDPRLGKVQDPAKRSALMTLSYIVNIGLVPGAVILYGVLRAGKRKRAAAATASHNASQGASQGASPKEGGQR